MKNQPTPSDHEVLTGLVERVTYQNAENGFCVLRVKARVSPWWECDSGTWPPRSSRQAAERAGLACAPSCVLARPSLGAANVVAAAIVIQPWRSRPRRETRRESVGA